MIGDFDFQAFQARPPTEFEQWVRVLDLEGAHKIKRIIIDITPDAHTSVYVHQGLTPIADPLFALLHELSIAQMTAGTAERVMPAKEPAEEMSALARYIDSVDPSDTKPGESLEARIRRVVEFYRGSNSARGFADEDEE